MKKTHYTTPTFGFVLMDGNQDVILASANGENFVSPGDDWGVGGKNI